MRYLGKQKKIHNFCFIPCRKVIAFLLNTHFIPIKITPKQLICTVIIKAAFIVQLLLFSSILGFGQQTVFTQPIQKAYFELLSLKLNQGNKILKKESIQHKNNPYFLLVNSYAHTLNILLYEDQSFYQKNKNQYNQAIKSISKHKFDAYWKKLIEAEIRFQAGLVKMRFNEEISASWEFKQSYQIIQKLNQTYPDQIPHKKLMGLFQLFLGSVPEKYNWITNLFRIQGSIDLGQKYLEEVSQSNSIFSLEATMLKAAADKFILKNPLCVSCTLKSTIDQQRDNYLFAYLYASILVKEGNSDAAFQTLSRFSPPKYIHFPLAYLLQGETMLYKGEYEKAQYYFLHFLKYTQGKNHVKDAYYKLFLAHWLAGDDEKAELYLSKVTSSGQSSYDADKYAQKFALSKELPDVHLMKARLSTDGGYLEKALEELRKYCFQKPEDSKDNIEFWYRKGRINQLKENTIDAYFYYKKTIALSNNKNHYFAPNACLQLGYLYREDANIEEARYYFTKAISYQDHEYKNSIDNKAKAALSALK